MSRQVESVKKRKLSKEIDWPMFVEAEAAEARCKPGQRVEFTDALGNVRHGTVVDAPDHMRAMCAEGSVFVSIVTVSPHGRRPKNPKPSVVWFEPHEFGRLRCDAAAGAKMQP